EELEDRPDRIDLGLVDHQPTAARVVVVTEDGMAANKLLSPPGGMQLVPGPLAHELPLVLREGKQNVYHHPTVGRLRVDRFRDRDESDPVLLQELVDAPEIDQGAREPVELV